MLEILTSVIKKILNSRVHYEVELCRSFTNFERQYWPLCHAHFDSSMGDRMSADWRDVTCAECHEMRIMAEIAQGIEPTIYHEVAGD